MTLLGLPAPVYPCQELTNSDQEEQVSDRVDAAQGLLATSEDIPGVTTVGDNSRPTQDHRGSFRQPPSQRTTSLRYAQITMLTRSRTPNFASARPTVFTVTSARCCRWDVLSRGS